MPTIAAYAEKHCTQLRMSGISRLRGWDDSPSPVPFLLSASTLSRSSSAMSTYSPLKIFLTSLAGTAGRASLSRNGLPSTFLVDPLLSFLSVTSSPAVDTREGIVLGKVLKSRRLTSSGSSASPSLPPAGNIEPDHATMSPTKLPPLHSGSLGRLPLRSVPRVAYPYTPFQGRLPFHSIPGVAYSYTLIDGSLTLTLYSEGRLPLHSIRRVAYPYTLFEGSLTLTLYSKGRLPLHSIRRVAYPYTLFEGSLTLTLYSKGRLPLHSIRRVAYPYTLFQGSLTLTLYSKGRLPLHSIPRVAYPYTLFPRSRILTLYSKGRSPLHSSACPHTLLRGRLPLLVYRATFYALSLCFVLPTGVAYPTRGHLPLYFRGRPSSWSALPML